MIITQFISEYNDESSSSTPLSSEVNFGAESNAVLLPAGQVRHQGELRWFHKLSWALYTFSLDVGMSVTIAFWAILRTEFDAFSWHCHAINSVALIMDLIVSGNSFITSLVLREFHGPWGRPCGRWRTERD